MNDATEMPRYKCHKEVHALKISEIIDNPNDSIDVFFIKEFEAQGFAPINLVAPEANRFRVRESDDMGYLVVYEDGYRSWSPTEVFETGYTRL